MRLLERKNNDEFSLTEHFVGNIPAYAILSHTWGSDDQEVKFKDMNEGSGKSKAGYRKIQFCGEQAARDGYRYFWVDTCCIDKSNNTELSEALNSMYRWYQDAAKCYVYLADVSATANESSQSGHDAFQNSRWFTRGWTLQELIAPPSVQFFSLEGEILGDKRSLERQIHERTGIPVLALQETPPSEFSVEERFSWARNRETKKAEDIVYSLFGIFGVFLPLLYGEGRENAFQRLQEQIDKKLPLAGVRQSLPFPRNTNFVGRESYLEQLAAKLNPQRFTTSCLWLALDGLGGVGKTQIALQFAYQIQEKSPDCSVFWVRASDRASFENSYREIAQKLGIPDLKGEKADVKRLVFTALEGLSLPWLLIVDNVDDYEVLRGPSEGDMSSVLIDYLPKRGNGAILFTTRDHKSATGFAKANVIRVKEMNRQESTELFENSFQTHNRGLLDDRASITDLLDLLLDLPLAIKQAAAFINNNSTSISEYLSLYRRSEEETIAVLSEDFEDDGRYDSQKNPVATTWLISFQQVRHQDNLAADYLSFIGVILLDDIPISLLPQGKSLLEQMKAIGTLIAYSFVTRRIEEEALNVHRLVHLATRNWLRMEDELLMWADRALIRLVEVIPAGGHTNREVWIRYLPHGINLVNTIEVCSDNEIAVTKLLAQIGLCQLYLGQYSMAEKILQRSLALLEKVLGKNNPNTLMSRNNLGEALSGQGKYAAAEEMHRKTLALLEEVLGKDHPDTLRSRNNLGIVLIRQGKQAAAEEMHRKTLALLEEVLGKDHPDTLRSRNNLGIVLIRQGKQAAAEEMHRKTLALLEEVLGKDHPDTLTSRNNLGEALSDQGKYAAAEEMQRETLELQEKLLGRDHPETLSSMNNLGVVLDEQGKHAAAEEMHRGTLALREKVLGKDHPETLSSMNNLGVVLDEQGKHAAAEEMHRGTLALREKVLGKDHPATLLSMNNLGVVLVKQGKHVAAEEMHRESLALQEKVLGKDHPDTLTSIFNLAAVLQEQRKIDEAITLFQVELDRHEARYGADDAETVRRRRLLAITREV